MEYAPGVAECTRADRDSRGQPEADKSRQGQTRTGRKKQRLHRTYCQCASRAVGVPLVAKPEH